MPRDPHHANAHITALAGLNDIYLHVDALDARCLSFLNGGDEELAALLPCANEVLLSVWWHARDSLASLREVGVIRAGGSHYPKVLFDIPDGQDDYEDEPRKAVASLVGPIGEVEQQIYHLMHAVDRGVMDVRKTAAALLLIAHLTSIALERVEAMGDGSQFRPVPKSRPISDTGPDVGLLVIELGQMYLDDPNRMSETESAFINDETRPRTREIGQILHDIGGKRTMIDVHFAIDLVHGPGAAGMLSRAWAGIGLWLPWRRHQIVCQAGRKRPQTLK
jgi:hypothetical protein